MKTLTQILDNKPIRKMHGCGNDFIVLWDWNEELLPEQAAKLCCLHYGIGSDGLIAVCKSRKPQAMYRMKFFNPDGSIAEMCGNGIRCFCKYLADLKLIPPCGICITDTDAGLLEPNLLTHSDRESTVCVNMGIPLLVQPKQATAHAHADGVVRGKAHSMQYTFISMGNPHAVFEAEDPYAVVRQLGPSIEKDLTLFPQKTNVEFIRILSPKEIRMAVWERGAGETLACGTGACASFAAAKLNGLQSEEATIHLKGGDCLIRWEGKGSPIFLTGNAVNVFEISAQSLDQFLI